MTWLFRSSWTSLSWRFLPCSPPACAGAGGSGLLWQLNLEGWELQNTSTRAKTLPSACQESFPPDPRSWPAALTEASTSATEAFSSSLSQIWMILKGSSGNGRSRFTITSRFT